MALVLRYDDLHFILFHMDEGQLGQLVSDTNMLLGHASKFVTYVKQTRSQLIGVSAQVDFV